MACSILLLSFIQLFWTRSGSFRISTRHSRPSSRTSRSLIAWGSWCMALTGSSAPSRADWAAKRWSHVVIGEMLWRRQNVPDPSDAISSLMILSWGLGEITCVSQQFANLWATSQQQHLSHEESRPTSCYHSFTHSFPNLILCVSRIHISFGENLIQSVDQWFCLILMDHNNNNDVALLRII